MFYIRIDKDGNAVLHLPSSAMPFKDGQPRFVTAPRGNKSWFKLATEVKPPLGVDQYYGDPIYSDLDQPIATITYPLIDFPPPPVYPTIPALSAGNSPVDLKADLEMIREFIMDNVSLLPESGPE